jgi:hypothetical protein
MKFHGKLYEGKHLPLLSWEPFDEYREVVKLKGHKVKNNKHLFNSLGLANYGEYSDLITVEEHTKYYKRTDRKVKYVYYRCPKKKCVYPQGYIDKGQMEKQLRELVLQVSSPPHVVEKLLE